MGFKKTLHDMKPAFTNDLWKLDLSSVSSAWRKFYRAVRIARFTVTEFAEQRMGFQCVALSYFGILAVVPLVALVFYITDGLGLTEKVDSLARTYLQASPEMLDMVVEKATNIIDTAQSGVVGLISALLFVWTIIWLLFQTERVFNNIWGIRKIGRKLYKRFSFYILMLPMIPFIVITFGYGIALYSNSLEYVGIYVHNFKLMKTILTWISIAVVSALTFSAMFKWIPATKVKYKYALISAIPTGIIFTLFQYLYLETQVFVSRLNSVYGVIAAIPLFMIWMNFSWQIVMYGCMLCRAFHNADDYNKEETQATI